MKYFAFLLIFAFAEASLPLPSYIQPCSQSDPNLNQCFQNNGNAAIPYMANGDPAYDIQPVKPLKWRPLLEVDMPPVRLILIDIDVYGLDQLTISTPNVDLNKREITMNLSSPLITWRAQYQIVLEVGGPAPSEKVEGNIEISFPNGVYDTTLEYEFFDLDNVQYAYVTSGFVKFENIDISFVFFGPSMNSMMEQAWAQAKTHFINQEVQEACGWAVATYFNDIFNNVPFNQVFTP